jgi:hypothetical protein
MKLRTLLLVVFAALLGAAVAVLPAFAGALAVFLTLIGLSARDTQSKARSVKPSRVGRVGVECVLDLLAPEIDALFES